MLPILTYKNLEEVYAMLADKAKPLALYFFSEDKKVIRDVTQRCRYGGGYVNDVVIHLATSNMGFGGIGESGMGSYHGKAGFDTFTHYKSVLSKANWLDLPFRYHPYSKFAERILRFFLR